MNTFDLAASAALMIAVYSGFSTGLLRSAITILAYLLAMPLAMGAVAAMSPQLQDVHGGPLAQNWLQFFAAFVVIGVALGKIGRILLDEAIGSEAGFGDRLGGAFLGAVRVGMVDHARAGVRQDRSGGAPAPLSRRLAPAPPALARRCERFPLASARAREPD